MSRPWFKHTPLAARHGLLAALLAMGLGAGAQTPAYPLRAVTLVVPFAAGGTSDAIGRATAKVMEAELGQPVVVVNRPGGGGVVGITSVAAGQPDGYTLVLGGLGSVVFPVAIQRGQLKFDPAHDLAPLGVVGSAPTVIAVRADLPARSLAELVSLARAAPDKLSFASAGVGGTLHVAGVLLEKAAQIALNHVPYKGGAPAMTDLAAGTVDIALADLTLLKPLLQSGRIRPLAMASGERSSLLPGVPTTAEAGLPNVRMDTWYAVFAPAATPAPALGRLRAALQKAQGSPELAAVLQAQGIAALATPLKDFEGQLKRDFATWPPLLARICGQNSCD